MTENEDLNPIDFLYFKYLKNMSWICKAGPTNLKQDTELMIANEFRSVDPKTKQIYSQIIFDENSLLLKKYQDWRRIKIETIDSRNLMKNLKEANEHFIDPSFPHSNTVLSKEFFHGDIEWKRVREVVENAVYSKQQTLKNLEKTKLNRKEFEKALILISRSSPTLFKELLSKTLNTEGVYEYKLFRGGYIRNVVIDDYIPTHEGFPLFVGPARQNEVYPMLLEKAIAKVCGSYEDIPENAEEILEIIFCGPVKNENIPELKQTERLGKSLKDCVLRRALCTLISKRDQKIRNYGLNDYEVYLLINHHVIEVQTRKQDVYELVSETKLSAWNGRFSLNDNVWNHIDPARKVELYQQIKTHHSFLIAESDVGKHFEELLIFESMDINNKDWCENQSDNAFPSFTTFQVQEKQRIFLRVTTKSKIRQTLILVRQVSPKQYVFVASYFNESSYKAELSVQVVPGKYILAVLHQWFLSNHGKYFVFLASEKQINLQKGGVVDNGFLMKSIASYEMQQADSQLAANKLYKMRLEIEKLGLAWLVLKPNASKTKNIKVDINHDLLNEESWEVLEPYKDVPTVHFSEKTQPEESMIVLKKRDIDWAKKYHFPVVAFKLKE